MHPAPLAPLHSPASTAPPRLAHSRTAEAAVAGYLAGLGPAYAAKTRRSLASDWRCFSRWCAEDSRTPFSAAPATVVAYLEAQAASHTIATLRRRLATLSHLHDALGAANPTRSKMVKLTLRGLARAQGARPQHRRAPLRQADVDRMLAILGGSLWDVRDKAILLTARDTLARRSELARLEVSDLEFRAASRDGRIVLCRTKGDANGRSAWLAPATCQALTAWLQRAGIAEGRVFRRIDNAGRVGSGLHPQAIGRRFKKLARAAGLDASRIGAHSTRIGTCVDLVADGQSLVAIQLAGGWASPALPAHYAADLLPELGAVARHHRGRAALPGPAPG